MSFYFDIPEGRPESISYYSDPIPLWVKKDFDADYFLEEILPALEAGKIACCCPSWGRIEVDVVYWPEIFYLYEDEIDEEEFIAQFSPDIQQRIQALKNR